MTVTQQGVITLLRSAITGEKLPLPQDFDLEAAYPELKKHNMDALLCEGAMGCGLSLGQPVVRTLFQCYHRDLLRSEGQLRQLRRIFAAFEESGIDYLPLKGSKMKFLYPKQELRYMGDADILIRLEQYGKIRPIMESLGFTEKTESDHELIWTCKELYVELHKHLIPSYNKDLYGYFGDGWQMARLESGTRHTMTAEDEWIFQFTHFAKHFRDGGIGCRYVVDLWVFLRNHPELDDKKLEAAFRSLQLDQFHVNIRRLIRVWFEDAQPDAVTDLLTQYIMESGSWGGETSRLLSRAVRDAKKMVGWRGRLSQLWQMAFPDARTLRDKYTVLKKAPWMLPLVWLYRPFYKIFRERGDLTRKKQNLDTLTTQSLQSRKEFLNTVGIDYHF